MLDLKRFEQPPSAFRIQPFWFWNGDMLDEEIRHQIREMADKGVGGFFICARQGLQIPYLSDAWFGKVRVAVEEADKNGMEVWLYDEYPYPSGIAGGEVILEHPDAKHYTLAHQSERVSAGQHVTLELPWAKILFAKAVPVSASGKLNWDQAIDVRSSIGNYQADPIFQKAGLTAYNQKRFFTYRTVQKMDWTAPSGPNLEEAWEVIIVQEQEIEDFKYYGTFVDPCNREAMAAFIRLTHDKYAQHLGDYFGKTIKGMFTDEIGLLGSIPWSPRLADEFLQRNGYDLREHLHALLYSDAEDAARIRYDYYQTVHLLLRESYHKQVHDWCERHGLQYVAEVPSVRMTTQLYSHVPGGDSAHEKLGRSLEWILNQYADNMRSNPKMVSSLARQLGRERNLIECFHSVGWSMTLQDARWMIDRMAAMGTNFFNFHAFFYTLDGLTKHDAPPSQFLQNPYWEHFRQLGDYTGRISYAMSCGDADISIAVLQPTTSLWTHMGNPFHGFGYGGRETQEKERLNSLKQWWVRICNQLTLSGRDFDHLDAELLAEANIQEGVLSIGRARYTLLILPPMTNLESAAWKKIQDFLHQGGKVISLGQLPYEAIEPKQWNEEELLAAFGLTQSEKGRFWTGHEETSVAGDHPWSSGAGNAYYLPFHAGAEASVILDKLDKLLEKLQPQTVRLLPGCGELSLLLQTRHLDDRTALVFISNQEQAVREVTLSIADSYFSLADSPASGSEVVHFEELSLDHGSVSCLQGNRSEAAWQLPIALAPFESHLLRVTLVEQARMSEAEGSRESQAQPWVWQIGATASWEMQAEQPNSVRFDTFRMILHSGESSPGVKTQSDGASGGVTVPVKTFIDQCADLTDQLPFPVSMRQLFGTPMKLSMAYPLHVSYTSQFVVEEPLESVRLVMDSGAISGQGVIRINGHVIQPERMEPYFLYDHSNVAYDVTAFLAEGVNELSVDVRIAHDWDGVVDALYLNGSFLVHFDGQHRPVLSAKSHLSMPLSAGPYRGYPYYAGTFTFARMIDLPSLPEADSFELSFIGWDSNLHDSVEVIVNGQSVGVRPWSPYRWTGPSKLLRKGANRVEVKVTNSLIGLLEGKYFDYPSHTLLPVNS
ncbi:hypothetical protein GCM10023310_20590 [Paenibacillus vulneris]|uniref:Glycosyl hydrolase n=1 Tax=Paenibacillus vulneris TaxID=1133364 RepID=A0ABW3UQ14_9BACL